jgi:2-succinyl-5-enolpyruvyl-6-hydroxy-3-cyclohexene-1-carboxylate synthase
MYGGYVREFFEAPEPALEGPSLRHLRTVAARAFAAAVSAPAGPVHVNFPFDKPLEPTDVPEDFIRAHPLAARGRPDGAPFVRITRARSQPALPEIDALAEEIGSSAGVIVAGPSAEPERVGPAVWELAASTGFPVLADPLSGARFGPASGAYRVAAYDLFLRDPSVRQRLKPSAIVRVGASPTSSALIEWLLQHSGVPHVVIDDGARWKDHAAVATRYVKADAEETLRALASRCMRTVAPEWEELWSRVETAALEALGSARGDLLEADVWSYVNAALSHGSTLFVSNSTPIRDLDALTLPREEGLEVLANRGASGIDGIVSTAFGIASQRAGPTVCVIGDLAFFHDQNGLLWSREADAVVVFVLVDNDGGGLFESLPIAAHEPHFTRFFATPHGLDLQRAAEMFDLRVSDVAIPDLGDALDKALHDGRTAILRVRSERAASHAKREQLVKAVSDQVREALARGPTVPMETMTSSITK